MERKIKNICGDLGDIKELASIKNDPNFVFENDPNFTTIVLYDVEGNLINVNSWIECANYVNGGWTNSVSQLMNGERTIFLFTLGLFLLYFGVKKFYPIYKEKK